MLTEFIIFCLPHSQAAAGEAAMVTEYICLPHPQAAAGEATMVTEYICLPHPQAAAGEAAMVTEYIFSSSSEATRRSTFWLLPMELESPSSLLSLKLW